MRAVRPCEFSKLMLAPQPTSMSIDGNTPAFAASLSAVLPRLDSKSTGSPCPTRAAMACVYINHAISIQGLGFRVKGLGLRVWGAHVCGFRVLKVSCTLYLVFNSPSNLVQVIMPTSI